MSVLHRPAACRTFVVALLLVAAAAMVLLGAAVPHTHAGASGLYNQEHDLTLYAVAGGAALVDSAPSLFVDAVLTALPSAAVSRPPAVARAHARGRAPPAA
jgi:hypothetical protein